MKNEKEINKFLNNMSGALKDRYGGIKPYTNAQISTTIESMKLKKEYLEIALNIFGDGEKISGYESFSENRKRYEGYNYYEPPND